MSTPISIDPSIPERTVQVCAAEQPTSLMVFFHGGGLTGGDHGEITDRVQQFTDMGCTVVSVAYRLYPQARYPEFLEDCAAGFAWAKEQFPALPTFICGMSAGGWLTAMLAVDPQWLAAVGHHPRELAGAIPVSGQMLTHFAVACERGVPLRPIGPETPDFVERRPWADEAAPIHHACADIPPWLGIAGSEDIVGRPEENQLMAAAMRGRGHRDATCLVFEGRTHGTIWSQVDQPGDPVFAAIADFMQRHTATCPAH